MNSLAEENYLKTVFLLADENGAATVKDIAHALNVTMPTVTNMAKKLAEKNFFFYESYKPIQLTEEGKRTAALIIRKHRLTEMFLVTIMGFGWEEVHNIAEEIEHISAPVFFEKMDEMLGFPTIDPHGSPIPDRQGKMTATHYAKLSDVEPGSVVVLRAVTHTSDDFLRFLNMRELALGMELTIAAIEPFDATMIVEYSEGRREVLSVLATDKLLVEIM